MLCKSPCPGSNIKNRLAISEHFFHSFQEPLHYLRWKARPPRCVVDVCDPVERYCHLTIEAYGSTMVVPTSNTAINTCWSSRKIKMGGLAARGGESVSS